MQFLSSSQEQNAKKEDTDEDVLRRANMLFNSKKHAELQKYLKRELPKRYKNVDLRTILVNSYYVEKNYRMAALHLDAILNLDPTNYAAKGMYADCLQYDGQIQKAIGAYEEILEENPVEIKAIRSLAELNQMIGNRMTCIKYLKMVEDNPNATEEDKITANAKLAKMHHEVAEYKNAILYYDKLQEHKPDDVGLMLTRVELYAKFEDWEKCVAIYNAILAIDPNNKEIYEKIGQMKFNLEKWDEALAIYNELMRSERVGSKKYLHHKNRIAEIYINQNKSNEAIAMLTELIKEHPTEDSLAFTLAQAYLGLGNYQVAVNLYTNLMENLPQDQLSIIRKHISNLVGAWAEDLFSQGSYNQAFDKFFLALKYNEENSEIYYKLGASNYILKSFADATSHFKRAIAINPQESRYYLGLGYSLDGINDIKNSKAAFVDALGIDPLNVPARIAYAISLTKEYDLESSLEEFMKALESTPSDPDLNYNIALNYEMLGDDDNAERYYKNTLKINKDHVEARHNLSLLLDKEITDADINQVPLEEALDENSENIENVENAGF